jgi:HD superfamily phosphohydrolase YqeK
MPNKKKLKKHVVSAINAAKEIFDQNKGDDNTAYNVALTFGVSRNVGNEQNFEEIKNIFIQVANFLNWQLVDEHTDDGIEEFVL